MYGSLSRVSTGPGTLCPASSGTFAWLRSTCASIGSGARAASRIGDSRLWLGSLWGVGSS